MLDLVEERGDNIEKNCPPPPTQDPSNTAPLSLHPLAGEKACSGSKGYICLVFQRLAAGWVILCSRRWGTQSELYRQHNAQRVNGLIFTLALVKTQLEAMQMSAGWFYGGGAEAVKGKGGVVIGQPRGTLRTNTWNLRETQLQLIEARRSKDGVLAADTFHTRLVSCPSKTTFQNSGLNCWGGLFLKHLFTVWREQI